MKSRQHRTVLIPVTERLDLSIESALIERALSIKGVITRELAALILAHQQFGLPLPQELIDRLAIAEAQLPKPGTRSARHAGVARTAIHAAQHAQQPTARRRPQRLVRNQRGLIVAANQSLAYTMPAAQSTTQTVRITHVQLDNSRNTQPRGGNPSLGGSASYEPSRDITSTTTKVNSAARELDEALNMLSKAHSNKQQSGQLTPDSKSGAEKV